MDDVGILTYRYVRLGLIGSVVALGLSVLIEMVHSSVIRGSISAYYYSPSRSVFVGALCAIGIALIALQGRPGGEDILLNLAGLLAPVVAIVPTPVCEANGPYGLSGCGIGKAHVPSEFYAGVVNNSWALGATAIAGMVVTSLILRQRLGEPEIRRGLLVAWALVLGFGVLASLWPKYYLNWAHYLAAVPLFVCITSVVVINSRKVAARDQQDVLGLSPASFRSLYRVLAALMILGIAGAVLGAVFSRSLPPSLPWVLIIEIWLLVCFLAFWVLQSMENWKTGLPQETISRTAA